MLCRHFLPSDPQAQAGKALVLHMGAKWSTEIESTYGEEIDDNDNIIEELSDNEWKNHNVNDKLEIKLIAFDISDLHDIRGNWTQVQHCQPSRAGVDCAKVLVLYFVNIKHEVWAADPKEMNAVFDSADISRTHMVKYVNVPCLLTDTPPWLNGIEGWMDPSSPEWRQFNEAISQEERKERSDAKKRIIQYISSTSTM